MKQLNFKHLHYFWVVAREGSIAAASRKLHITPQTISGQLSSLEESMGSSLFNKVGRGLELSVTGQLVLDYANEIFQLGQELTDIVRGVPIEGPSTLIVGAASALPKTIVHKVIEPALSLPQGLSLISREGDVSSLLAELAIHKLDIVFSDTPLPASSNVRAYNHLLGESGVTFFAAPKLAKTLKQHFPQSLSSAPMLLPTRQNAIRHTFDEWLERHDIRPTIRAQFDDSALMKSFGKAGEGVFFMSSIIEDEICRNFDVRILGRVPTITQKYYAISAERKVKHPAISLICDSARNTLFQ